MEKLKLCFTTYIGDGHTKAYPTVVKAEPYPNKQIVKGECVGHVQKRVGGRLRKFKKVHGNELLADKKLVVRAVNGKNSDGTANSE